MAEPDMPDLPSDTAAAAATIKEKDEDTTVGDETSGDAADAAATEDDDDDSSSKENEAGDDGGEWWDLTKAFTVTELKKSKPTMCSWATCNLVACSKWESTSEEDPWFCCLDCQENDFNGWPKKKKEFPIKFLTEENRQAIAEKCSNQEEPAMPNLPTSMPLLPTTTDKKDSNDKPLAATNVSKKRRVDVMSSPLLDSKKRKTTHNDRQSSNGAGVIGNNPAKFTKPKWQLLVSAVMHAPNALAALGKIEARYKNCDEAANDNGAASSSIQKFVDDCVDKRNNLLASVYETHFKDFCAKKESEIRDEKERLEKELTMLNDIIQIQENELAKQSNENPNSVLYDIIQKQVNEMKDHRSDLETKINDLEDIIGGDFSQHLDIAFSGEAKEHAQKAVNQADELIMKELSNPANKAQHSDSKISYPISRNTTATT